ncbi:MAG: hypothetical protein JKY56_18130, partial [Kofleriaceae bacterium]|nr:hypothetical protein [Kofleriaceae bacterium]
GDADGDGDIDIITGDIGNVGDVPNDESGIVLWINDGGGNFTRRIIEVPSITLD